MSTTPQDLATQQLVAAITRMAQNIIAAQMRDAKNALHLEGLTVDEIIVRALKGTAANASALEGQTLAQITASIQGGSQEAIDAVSQSLADFMARRDNPFQVTAAQVGLGAFDGKTIADDAALTAQTPGALVDAAQLQARIDTFWAEQVGTAPDTMNSIEELAAALQNNPDAISALQQLVTDNRNAIDALSTKTGNDKTELQGNIDTLRADMGTADAQTLSDAKAYADSLKLVKATAEQATAGTDDAVYMTPLTVHQAIAAGLAGTAENANKLNGMTYEEIKADILTGKAASAGTADNSTRLGGSTLAEVIAASAAAVDLTPYLTIASVATAEEVAAGTVNDHYVSPAVLKTVLGGYLTTDGKAADSTLFNGKTYEQVMADVVNVKVTNAGNADTLGGFAADYFTPVADFNAAIQALTDAFNQAADDMEEPAPTEPTPA